MKYSTAKRILEGAGFTNLSYLGKAKINRHIIGQYNKPISDDLYNYLTDSLLGDGCILTSIRPRDIPEYIYDIHNYNNALAFLTELKTTSFIENNTDFTEIIKQFNTATKVISDIPTSMFVLTKSILESHWVEHINIFFEENGYKTKLTEYKPVRNSAITGKRPTDIEIVLTSRASVQLEFIRKQ